MTESRKVRKEMADTTKEESKVRGLEDEIARLKEENAELKKQKLNNVGVDAPRASEAENVRTEHEKEHRQSLYPHEIERYSRQLLLAQGFGVSGQLKLLSSSVLVVGAGGIGSTVLMYLAALGVGCISVLDFDSVSQHTIFCGFLSQNSETICLVVLIFTGRNFQSPSSSNPQTEQCWYEQSCVCL